MYNETLQAVPLTCLQGVTVDISALLRLHIWQPIFFKLSESSFPSESKEALGHVVGISEHCGHALTYKDLSSEDDVIIYRSLLRPATPYDDNVRACMSGGESPIHNGPLKDRSSMDESKLVSTHTDDTNADAHPPPVFNSEDLIGSSLWTNRKMVTNSEDELSNSLKTMNPRWKIPHQD
jgi:hypothetical protein